MTPGRETFHGVPALVLRASDGAQAVVTLQGGHVVSWRAAGSDVEQLYLSPASLFADGKAIRGGVPVIFPQFSDRGPFVRHGFARTMRWQLLRDDATDDGRSAQVVLGLTDDAASREQWPQAFALALRVRVGGDALTMDMTCTNTGSSPWAFTAALHTYLAVHDVTRARLHGMAGTHFDDRVAGVFGVQGEAPLQIDGEVDRVYASVTRALRLDDPRPTGIRRLTIAQQGFTDVVVWNPGAMRCAALSDMPVDGYRHMLCVESACITDPVTLDAGQLWTASQTLTVAS